MLFPPFESIPFSPHYIFITKSSLLSIALFENTTQSTVCIEQQTKMQFGTNISKNIW